jgi:hypothetical protein
MTAELGIPQPRHLKYRKCSFGRELSGLPRLGQQPTNDCLEINDGKDSGSLQRALKDDRTVIGERGIYGLAEG